MKRDKPIKPEDWMRAGDAAIELNVSRNIISRLIADNEVESFKDPADRRITWVKRSDIMDIKNSSPSRQEGKKNNKATRKA